jgi:DNA-binding XRE family transcriptional regulator
MKLSEAIQNFRKQHNLTQAETARILQVSEGTICLWENSKVEPKQEIVWRRLRRHLPELGVEKKDMDELFRDYPKPTGA